jgi:hypothetical protein
MPGVRACTAFRHRVGLRHMHARLDRLLGALRFGTVSEALAGLDATPLPLDEARTQTPPTARTPA